MDFASSQRCETCTHPPIQWERGALSLGVKRPGREADHSPLFSADFKERVKLYPTPPVRLHCVVLIESTGTIFSLPYLKFFSCAELKCVKYKA
jgi:hypothetical protein